MPTVTFTKQKKKIEVPEGANLRDAALQNGIEMHAGPHKVFNCRGNGLCASCRVNVNSGIENLQRKTLWEKFLNLNPLWMFARIGHEKTMTLACQSKVEGDCEVETTPEMNWHGDQFWG